MKPVKLLVVVAFVTIVTSCGSGNGSYGNGGGQGSLTWQLVNTPFPQLTFIDFGSNGHWFIAERTQGFYRSTDGGSTWSPINSGIPTTFGWTINVVPGSGDVIAGIYSRGGLSLHPVGFYRSTNEGTNWTSIQSGQLDSAPAVTGCAFSSSSNVVCGGFWAQSPASGGWYSTNGGQTAVAASTTSTNGTAVFSLALDPVSHDFWMGTEQYGVFRSTDNGATWSTATPPDTQIDSVHGIRDGNAYAITFDTTGNVLFGSQGGIWKSSSNGSGFAWANVKSNTGSADGKALGTDANGTLYYGHRHDPSDPTVLYCSTDKGNSWNACDSGLPKGKEVHRLVVNPSDKKMYATIWDESAQTGALYVTVNPVQ
jgi:hypothetical protein